MKLTIYKIDHKSILQVKKDTTPICRLQYLLAYNEY